MCVTSQVLTDGRRRPEGARTPLGIRGDTVNPLCRVDLLAELIIVSSGSVALSHSYFLSPVCPTSLRY